MSSIPRPPAGMPGGTPPAKPRKKKRRWIYRLFWLMLLCLIAIGTLPYLASSVPSVRDFLLTRAVPNLNGSITAEDASLGWEKPIEFKSVEICSPGGMPVVQVEELKGDRPLWKILLKPSVLGTYHIVRPRLMMVTYPDGSTNLSEVFTGAEPMAIEQPKSREVPNLSVTVKMVDGSLMVSDSLGQNAWVAEPIDFGFRLRHASETSDGRSRLELPAERVFDHISVTPEVCQDMLKYIAPVMSDATRVAGTFSIELDNWSFPLDSPGEGSGKGELTVHELSIGAGPMVQPILATLGIQDQLVSIDEAPVKFELLDGRMRHEGLEFRVNQIKFTTSGSVGVKDETLDLAIMVQIPKEIQVDLPILQALAGQSITIPIRGTLNTPQVDVKTLGRSGIKAFRKTFDRILTPPDDTKGTNVQ